MMTIMSADTYQDLKPLRPGRHHPLRYISVSLLECIGRA